MEALIFADPEFFGLVVLPLFIFFARIVDVSLGTIRIIYISKGIKHIVPILGFVEILIWITAISQIMQNATNVLYYVAYAGGFAMGNYVGMHIEQKLAVGIVAVRIVTKKDATPLTEFLKSEKYGYTVASAKGISGNVRIVYSIIRRVDLPRLTQTIRRFNPNAFISVEDVMAVSHAEMPPSELESKYRRMLSSGKKGL